jgi:putative tricarboxylic transport membrane protein
MNAFFDGLSALGDPMVLLGVVAGTVIGMLIGCFPGVGATTSVAIASAFTITMSPVQGLAVLLGIYMAACFGDRVPAILVNTPGTPASIASTLDGYPLAKQGKAGLALGISALGSGIGALIGILALAVASFPLANVALEFGPAEFFALVVFALTMMVSVAGTSLPKGLAMGMVGLLIATVGVDPIFGNARFTAGVPELESGVSFIPLIIGLFGVAEVFNQILTRTSIKDEIVTQLGRLLPNRAERRRLTRPVLTASAVGTVVGAMPGAGGDIAGLVSWDQSKRFSKHPEEYGKGSIEGLAAADTANNAQVGGAMATTLALGIPGDSVSAVLIGSMVIWGIAPGPSLYSDHPDIVWTIVFLLGISTVIATALSFARLQSVIKLLTLPKALLWSLILIFCLVGSYAAQNQIFDVWLVLAAGIFGLLMRRFEFPAGPLVLGLILGPLAESNLRRALVISDGSPDVFFTSPISLVLLILSAVAIVFPIIQRRRKKKSIVADGIATGTIHTPAEDESPRVLEKAAGPR